MNHSPEITSEAATEPLNVYTFRDNGADYLDKAFCAMCGDDPADIELHRAGKIAGYVCLGCLRAAKNGGPEGWALRLHRRAVRHRLLAERLEKVSRGMTTGFEPDAEFRFELHIYSDAFSTRTAAGTLELHFEDGGYE